jgi:hypothetical protein
MTAFREAYDLFEKIYLSSKKLRTRCDYKRVLKRHYRPALASKRLDIITSHMAPAITDQHLADEEIAGHFKEYNATSSDAEFVSELAA